MVNPSQSCPKCGSKSSDPEFCSECGAAIATYDRQICPACGEARAANAARFCDTCRYDFLARQPFAPQPHKPNWELRAIIDISLRGADDPMPTSTAEQRFPLDRAEYLIGRGADHTGSQPQIALADPGISRRHARIALAADGALTISDLGSMNGTRLNGKPLTADTPTPLQDGDDVTLGCWTRLKPVLR